MGNDYSLSCLNLFSGLIHAQRFTVGIVNTRLMSVFATEKTQD